MASYWNLPILFALEYNHYDQSTPSPHPGRRRPRRAPRLRIEDDERGVDVLEIHRKADAACRSSLERPALLPAHGHLPVQPAQQGRRHRDPAEIEGAATRPADRGGASSTTPPTRSRRQRAALADALEQRNEARGTSGQQMNDEGLRPVSTLLELFEERPTCLAG